jgi:formamidopyrimidine-DNA glycosylase
MTEGPEATHLAKFIAKNFKNKRLRKMSIVGGRYKRHGLPKEMKEFQAALPMKLLDVYKKGKVIFFLFENNWCMISRMGMVGWFSKPGEDKIHKSDPNIVFEFENGELHYFDFRNFGTLVFTQDPMEIYSQIDGIAPDVLDNKVTMGEIEYRVHELVKKKPNMPLEELLMDQSLLISGIGNIIKSEVLYDAKISPKRTVKEMSKDDWDRLFHSAKKVSKKIYKFLETRGLDFNGYFKLHTVYKQERDPHGHLVKTHKAKDGRTTFWVPEVQH